VGCGRGGAGQRDNASFLIFYFAQADVFPATLDFHGWRMHRSNTRYLEHILTIFRCVCVCLWITTDLFLSALTPSFQARLRLRFFLVV